MNKTVLTPPRLRVTQRGGQNVVLVPRDWAGDLRIYLHTFGVRSAAPELVDREMASVEPSPGADPELVQLLLNRWERWQ